MTPKSEIFFWKFSLEMIEFILISAVISGEMWIVRYKALRAQLQKIHHEKKFGNW